MISDLYKKDVIGEYQYNLINNLLDVLNRAIHSNLNKFNNKQK